MIQSNTEQQPHYLVFSHGAPLGMVDSRQSLEETLQWYPTAIYAEYRSYAEATKDYYSWVNAHALGFQYDDGGRSETGYKGRTGDCVVRSIAIATGKPYQEVYDAINRLAKLERIGKRKKKKSNARTGVYRTTASKYLEMLGWKWVPTMGIGKGCRFHLRKGELPQGRLIVSVSKHYTAVIDGVICDTHNCGRNGTRCVYGYYIKK